MQLVDILRQKYKSLNLQVKIVYWFTVVGVLQKGISVITTPIFTRVLSTADYGLFSVFSAYNSVLTIIITLNLSSSPLNIAFTKKNSSKEKIVSSFQSLALLFSGIYLAIGIIFRNQIAKLMGLPVIVVVFLFLGILFKEPYTMWTTYKRYQFDYVKPVIITLIISFLTPILSLIAIWMIPDFQGVARILTYIIVNAILPGILFYGVNYKKDKTFFDRELWTFAITFSTPLVAHYLSETLLNQTDRIMINALAGTSEAGIYSVAFSAASLFTIFSSSLNQAFMPWQYKKLKVKDYRSLGRVSYIIFSLIAALLSLLIMFAPEIVSILAGAKYTEAIYLIPTLSASAFFGFMYEIFGRVELFYEKKMYVVIGTITAALLNIVLNAWWIPIFGYLAAGFSTLVSHMLLCLMHALFYRHIRKKYMDSANVYNLKICAGIGCLVLLVAVVMTLLYSHLMIRIWLLLAGIVTVILFRKPILQFINGLIRQLKN